MATPNKSTHSTVRLTAEEYAEGILKKDIVILSRAITLAESRLASDQNLAEELLQQVLPKTGNSIRVGITGVPGVGKSTFIEALGKHLTSEGKRLAVLAIDPSSIRTQGSILGDKTRMDELARDENAFIRPTSTSTALGGVADHTREAILLCEAAGFDVVIVETVGVGQSEVNVRNMVDFFLLLMLGGAGDELQGIKKGIMEMADGVVITKADGDNRKRASQAQSDYQHALHLLPKAPSGWVPKVLITSALEKKGLKETWQMIEKYREFCTANGYFDQQRKDQNQAWFHESIENQLKLKVTRSLKEKMNAFEQLVVSGSISPGRASRKIVEEFFQSLDGTKS